MSDDKEANDKEANDKDLEIIIKTTNGRWKSSFSQTTKVQAVIDAAVEHFGYSKEGEYQLHLEGDRNNPFEPEESLLTYKIKAGSELILSDLGVNV